MQVESLQGAVVACATTQRRPHADAEVAFPRVFRSRAIQGFDLIHLEVRVTWLYGLWPEAFMATRPYRASPSASSSIALAPPAGMPKSGSPTTTASPGRIVICGAKATSIPVSAPALGTPFDVQLIDVSRKPRQSLEFVDPTSRVVPMLQRVHAVIPVAVEKVPAGHRVQSAAGDEENLPGEQRVHEDAAPAGA